MKGSVRAYHVTRCDRPEDALEKEALERAARVMGHPRIDRVVPCGVTADGIPLVCYEAVPGKEER